MYCKFYVHSSSVESVVSILETHYGSSQRKFDLYLFQQFDICLKRNDETDPDKMRACPDGFLYYEIVADLDIYSDHVRVTDTILKLLWDHNMPTVASCDYEEELTQQRPFQSEL